MKTGHSKSNDTGAGPQKMEELLGDPNFKKAALVLRAVNHPLRQQVLKLLHQHGRMTVSGMYKTLHLEQSVASQHLAILRSAGVVLSEREGKHIFYSVHYQRLRQVQLFSADLLACAGQ